MGMGWGPTVPVSAYLARTSAYLALASLAFSRALENREALNSLGVKCRLQTGDFLTESFYHFYYRGLTVSMLTGELFRLT